MLWNSKILNKFRENLKKSKKNWRKCHTEKSLTLFGLTSSFFWTYDVYHTFAVKQKALAINPCDAIFFAKEICGLLTLFGIMSLLFFVNIVINESMMIFLMRRGKYKWQGLFHLNLWFTFVWVLQTL